MTRLDSVIRRLEAQRSCLNWAAEHLRDREGVVFEVGLGNGRTYDHLRFLLPDHEIYVFERLVAAHPSCIPQAPFLILGDLLETLAPAAQRFAGRCIMAHCDIGVGVPEQDRPLIECLNRELASALAPGALVVSDQALSLPHARELPLPPGVAAGRYHLFEYCP